jgi:hypothetical protein
MATGRISPARKAGKAQILPLDGPGSPCRVDHAFHEGLRNGRWRDLAGGTLTGANFATDGSGAPLPRPVTLLCRTAFSPALIDPTAQAASAGALQRNSTHRAFRRLFPPVPAACGSVRNCQAHFLPRGSPFLGVSADPRADDAIRRSLRLSSLIWPLSPTYPDLIRVHLRSSVVEYSYFLCATGPAAIQETPTPTSSRTPTGDGPPDTAVIPWKIGAPTPAVGLGPIAAWPVPPGDSWGNPMQRENALRIIGAPFIGS